MDTFLIIFVYMGIGGLLAGVVDKNQVEKCDEHLPAAEIFYISAAWPAIITYSYTTTEVSDPSDICNVEEG